MFERFTERARRVVVLAQEEARMLEHNYIGTEHLLLGLLREEDGVAARVLAGMRISLGDARADVEEIVGRGQLAPVGHLPFTPRAKKVLELSLREALQLGHNYIGTEHVLLGLVREGEGVAAQVLEKRGATMDRLRQSVIQLLSGYVGGQVAAAGGGMAQTGVAQTSELASEIVSGEPTVSAEDFPTCPNCRSPLAETLAATTLDLKVEEEPSMVKMAYCSRCGTALGTIP